MIKWQSLKLPRSFGELFPQAEIAVVLAKGIQNTATQVEDARGEIDELLEKSTEEATKYLTEAVFSENKVISVWRQAYQQFKTKKGVRCSIEALLKRIEKGTGVSSINPLVDIYNAVSLTYGLPCGGEDIDTFKGDLLLTKAAKESFFWHLVMRNMIMRCPGKSYIKTMKVPYAAGWTGVTGRYQRYRKHNECISHHRIGGSSRKNDLEAAAGALADLTRKYLGGSTEIAILNISDRELAL